MTTSNHLHIDSILNNTTIYVRSVTYLIYKAPDGERAPVSGFGLSGHRLWFSVALFGIAPALCAACRLSPTSLLDYLNSSHFPPLPRWFYHTSFLSFFQPSPPWRLPGSPSPHWGACLSSLEPTIAPWCGDRALRPEMLALSDLPTPDLHQSVLYALPRTPA